MIELVELWDIFHDTLEYGPLEIFYLTVGVGMLGLIKGGHKNSLL